MTGKPAETRLEDIERQAGITRQAFLSWKPVADTRGEVPYKQPEAAGGYARLTPVQAIKIDPGYRARMTRRCFAAAALIIAVGVAVWLLASYIL
jgi:hypothetical protein